VKKIIIVLGLALLVGGLVSVAAEKGQFTGWLSDAKCAANGAKASQGVQFEVRGERTGDRFCGRGQEGVQASGADKVRAMVGMLVLSGSKDAHDYSRFC
jgi:hypothetical protein